MEYFAGFIVFLSLAVFLSTAVKNNILLENRGSMLIIATGDEHEPYIKSAFASYLIVMLYGFSILCLIKSIGIFAISVGLIPSYTC